MGMESDNMEICPICRHYDHSGRVCSACDCEAQINLPQNIDHPPHYGGADNPYEAIKVIEAWKLGFNLGNTVKYICRAGKKLDRPGGIIDLSLDDLKKAAWYLNREIENQEKVK